MNRHERLLKRALVLGRWGYLLDFSTNELGIEVLETDERLADWFGEIDGGVADELAAIDLIAGSNLTLEA